MITVTVTSNIDIDAQVTLISLINDVCCSYALRGFTLQMKVLPTSDMSSLEQHQFYTETSEYLISTHYCISPNPKTKDLLSLLCC